MQKIVLHPCAKINLGLNVVARRADGYHDLETVFYPIPLCDRLEVKTAERSNVSEPQINLSVSGNKIDGNTEDNLVVRAFRLIASRHNVESCDVLLDKQIPTQAGLGGGSSDAASMILALNKLNNLKLTDRQMQDYAAQLGADCAFFITSQPVYATGIGNVFEDVKITDELSEKWMAIVKPPVAVSTKEAYSGIKPQPVAYNCLHAVASPVASWREKLTNDFEETILKIHPEIGKIKESLYGQGAIFSQMSGSGSAVYAIFDNKPTDLNQPQYENCFISVFPLTKVINM